MSHADGQGVFRFVPERTDNNNYQKENSLKKKEKGKGSGSKQQGKKVGKC